MVELPKWIFSHILTLSVLGIWFALIEVAGAACAVLTASIIGPTVSDIYNAAYFVAPITCYMLAWGILGLLAFYCLVPEEENSDG